MVSLCSNYINNWSTQPSILTTPFQKSQKTLYISVRSREAKFLEILSHHFFAAPYKLYKRLFNLSTYSSSRSMIQTAFHGSIYMQSSGSPSGKTFRTSKCFEYLFFCFPRSNSNLIEKKLAIAERIRQHIHAHDFNIRSFSFYICSPYMSSPTFEEEKIGKAYFVYLYVGWLSVSSPYFQDSSTPSVV